MKTRTKIAIAAAALYIAGVVTANYIQSKDNRMHLDCPHCGAHSVLHCGYDIHGDAHGHCLDCGSDVTVYGYAPD